MCCYWDTERCSLDHSVTEHHLKYTQIKLSRRPLLPFALHGHCTSLKSKLLKSHYCYMCKLYKSAFLFLIISLTESLSKPYSLSTQEEASHTIPSSAVHFCVSCSPIWLFKQTSTHWPGFSSHHDCTSETPIPSAVLEPFVFCSISEEVHYSQKMTGG